MKYVRIGLICQAGEERLPRQRQLTKWNASRSCGGDDGVRFSLEKSSQHSTECRGIFLMPARETWQVA